MDIIKKIKNEWMKDPIRYLYPSLEYMLIALLLTVPIIIIAILLSYSPVILLYFITETQMYLLIPLIVIFAIIFYSGLIVYSIVMNGILIGGTSVVAKRMMMGEKYEFFDIVKTGWKNRNSFVPLAGATLLTQMGISYIVSIALCALVIPFFLLALIHPAFLLIPLFLFIIVYIVLILFMMFLLPFPYLTFTYQQKNKTKAWRSVQGALRFMIKEKKMMFQFGAFMYLVQLIASFVPGLGIIVVSASILYLHQCLNIALDIIEET